MERNSLCFLHVGLGSMGKRRIRNLLWHGIPKKQIFGFDLSAARGQEVEEKYGIKTFTDFNEAEIVYQACSTRICPEINDPKKYYPYGCSDAGWIFRPGAFYTRFSDIVF